jgi:hypothetical protein
LNETNRFFKKLYSSPSLLWKGGAGVLFIALGFTIVAFPAFIDGLDVKTRYLFAGLLILYGLFRWGTFYAEYKSKRDE